MNSIEDLLKQNKPILLVLNRCDQWSSKQAKLILSSIHKKLSVFRQKIKVALVASSPRVARVKADGTVRSEQKTPKVDSLKKDLKDIVEKSGELFLCINSLRIADQFYKLLKESRLQKKKEAAQSLIGKYLSLIHI